MDDTDVIPFKDIKDLPVKTRILMENVIQIVTGNKDSDRWLKIKAKGDKGTNINWEFRM